MWNQRYTKPGYLFGTAPAQFLHTHQSYLKPGQTALAVADGEGRNSVFLAQKGLKVTAFDYAEMALKKAKALAEKNQVEIDYQLSSIEDWAWQENTYDVVIAIFIQFTPPEERAKIFINLQKSLKVGGLLMLHGYTPKQIEFGTGGPKAVQNLYTEQLLENSFEKMDILHLNAYEKSITEGKGHAGMSALIDLVARKLKQA